MGKGNFKHLASYSGFGYAYHKIILDDYNKPIDYIFLETNSFFAEVIGIKTLEFINQKISKVLPDFFQSDYERINIYGNIAINGGEHSFEYYSEPLNRWFKVLVSSTEKSYFTTIYTDITNYKTEDFDRKQIEEDLKESEEKYRLLIENSHDIIQMDILLLFHLLGLQYLDTHQKM
jgi:PAS domain-containing protein